MLPSSGVLESEKEGQKLDKNCKEGVHNPLDQTFNNSAPDVIEIIDDESVENEPENNNRSTTPEKQDGGAKISNPFALFAFQSTEPLPSKRKLDSSINKSRFQKWNTDVIQTKKPRTEESKKPKKCVPPPKMKDVSMEEQNRIRKKWHSLLDPEAPLEVKRFQMLVAARLHARCQEASVQKAMTRLRESFPSFTVDTIANTDPESLVPCIKNVVHYNVKAQHIVKAAQEVKTKFQRVVPEDEKSLLELTGIGNVFADLLAFVNTKAAYKKLETEK